VRVIVTSALFVSLLVAGVARHRQENNTQSLTLPNEKHIGNLKQLTFGGENAEAYFSSDGKQLIFQSTREGRGCDQIYTMNIDGSNVKLI
jgi:TolB protein